MAILVVSWYVVHWVYYKGLKDMAAEEVIDELISLNHKTVKSGICLYTLSACAWLVTINHLI